MLPQQARRQPQQQVSSQNSHGDRQYIAECNAENSLHSSNKHSPDQQDEDSSVHLRYYARLKAYKSKSYPKIQVLEPENEDGQVEYKRELFNPSYNRRIGLSTQMSFRLDEGQGLATYMLGVEDNGMHSLNSIIELEISIINLTQIARNLGAKVTNVRTIFLKDELELVVQSQEELASILHFFKDPNFKEDFQLEKIARVVVNIHHIDVSGRLGIDTAIKDDSVPNNFLVLGPSGSGKSSLIGSLVSNDLDNGLGYSRCCVMRHRHEFSGQSSCVSRLYLENNYGKEVVMTDTPGNEKYLKQTLAAATLAVDYALLIVEYPRLNNADYIIEVGKYLSIVQNYFMNKRVLVIANKCDLAKEKLVLKDIFPCFRPVALSCVSGYGMHRLMEALFKAPKRLSRHLARRHGAFEFVVTAIHTNMIKMKIVEGFVRSGTLDLSQSLQIVKSENGTEVHIKSIQINHKNMTKVFAGQFCCLGVEVVDRQTKSINHELKLLTESQCVRTERFLCEIQFLSELKKAYNNASVQLIYLNTRYNATLYTMECEFSDGSLCSKGSNIDFSEGEESEATTPQLIDCEVIVDGGVTLLPDGSRFYVCDFSQILGVGRITEI